MTHSPPVSPPASVTLTRWMKHGDHPAVQTYGESTLEQFPAYAACGVVLHDFAYQHVAPGFWLVTTTSSEGDSTRVARPGELEVLLGKMLPAPLEVA